MGVPTTSLRKVPGVHIAPDFPDRRSTERRVDGSRGIQYHGPLTGIEYVQRAKFQQAVET